MADKETELEKVIRKSSDRIRALKGELLMKEIEIGRLKGYIERILHQEQGVFVEPPPTKSATFEDWTNRKPGLQWWFDI